MDDPRVIKPKDPVADALRLMAIELAAFKGRIGRLEDHQVMTDNRMARLAEIMVEQLDMKEAGK